MKLRDLKIVFLATLLAVPAMVKASDDDESSRHWAVDVKMNPMRSMQFLYESHKNGAMTSGPNLSAHVEYFIPSTKFSVFGGYDRADIDFYDGDISTSMDLLSLGARWYFCPREWCIQPYLGANSYWYFAKREENGTLEVSGTQHYTHNYNIVKPRKSVAPTIGFDLYIFSSLAIEIDYGARFAFDSSADVSTKYSEKFFEHEKNTRDPMHCHTLSVGLKLTFPFKFTQNDINGLLNLLFGTN